MIVQVKTKALHIGLFIALACFMACLFFVPAYAYAVTSEELFAEADGLLRQIDLLQTTINEEYTKYDTAMAEHDKAMEDAAAASVRIEEEQKRLQQLQTQLATCASSMYKKGSSTSFFDVVLGSASFDEFLTKWDALNAITNQGASLVEQSKQIKANEEAAKAEYEAQIDVAAKKMEEAEKARIQIEATQKALQEEAEKVTEEAVNLLAKEEHEKELARQAELAAEAAEKALQGSNIFSGSELFANPLPNGTITSTFGWRDFNGGSFHRGLDLAAPEGTPYYAAEAGTVIFATYDGGYNGGAGNWVVIVHGNGLISKYMHSSAVHVKVGDRVERGQNIGAVGNTGDSYGAHLHFQVEYNGVAVDPTAFL